MRPDTPASWGVPGYLRKAGLASWLILGIAGAIALGAFLLYITQGLTVPLVLAVVIGAVFAPWVDFLEKLHFKRWVGTFVVLFLLLAVAFGTVALVVEGIVSQSAEIAENIEAGITQLSVVLEDAGLDPDLPQKALDQATESEGAVGGGLVGVVVGGISSAASFIIGGFVALNILFFLMKDAHTISGWLRDRASGVVATTLLSDSARSLRAYFRGKTIVAASSSITVYVGALIIGVPLAASIALVTFFTSYIPYLGAFIAGAFAVLLALGEGGLPMALAILLVVVLANAVVESLVTPLAVGSTLNLHPLVVLIVTILGGVFAGFIGVTLAAPVTAISVEVVNKLRAAGAFD